MLLCFWFFNTWMCASAVGIHSLGTCPDSRTVTPGATKMDCADVLELLDLLWSAGCRHDSVTAINQFIENDGACLACIQLFPQS